ncbi:outer membrane protein assembly factor BamE [Pseudohalocynthiibacter aestuariivivens]|uniref:Outer membrane protein assembly factor BamE n=1 Tax=Roseovarius pelagicus TaxID=2980108 RepID=A0ABY6DB51_9RHOB|nr:MULTISPECIES: outer membrane protein assembly factor BamE [Rhodobacterales]QIE44708.1 outer membrane protein assembly factor BamE [Pseudohalocynthiibacter aestuariivivens]UXX83381.1 outer membrane protein assembly factor BamE [Roseovarius pelagicus]
MTGLNFTLRAIVVVLGLVSLVACTSIYRNHGYVPPEEDLNQLVVGVDSRATVDDVIGAPSAAGILGEGDYYYVRSRMKHFGMMRPEVIERQVLAISFDQSDTIANIETFSLRDGNIVPLTRRVTDSSVTGKGVLRQILDNFGNIDPTQFF